MLKYRFSYRVKLSLLVALLLPLLLKLGFWQLSRHHEKFELEQTLAERQSLPALSLSEVQRYEDPMYLPVNITGHFNSTQYFLLDNQIYQGKAGYDLIMPFITANGEWLLVNRGWLPSVNRLELPEITTPKGEINLSGSLYRQLGKPFTLGEDVWGNDWPKRIQAIHFNRMSDALKQPLPLFIVQLNANESGVFQVRPKEMKTSASKHLGYAVQWFLMAMVLLGLYLWQMKRGFFRKHHQNQHFQKQHLQEEQMMSTTTVDRSHKGEQS